MLLLTLSCLLIVAALKNTANEIYLAPLSFVPIAAYLGPLMVSWAYSSTHPPLTLFDQVPSSLVIFLAVVALASRPGFEHRLTGAISGWVTLIALDAVVQFQTGSSLVSGQYLILGRVTGPFTSSTDLVLLPIALPFLFFFLGSNSRRSRVLWLVVPLIVAAVLLSGSRNAWYSLILALLLIGYLTKRRVFVVTMLCLLTALLAIGYLGNVGSIRTRTHLIPQIVSEGRIAYWIVAWRMFLAAPLLGQGPGTFSLLYLPYRQEAIVPPYVVEDPRLPPHPHNLILEVLAEQGLVGAIALFSLLLVAAGKLVRRARLPGQQQVVRTISVSASLLFFCGLADLSLWREWVNLYFWLLYGLAYGSDRERKNFKSAAIHSSGSST
jgi:O-antigen ligase